MTRGDRQRVLVVDDDVAIGRLVERRLQSLDVEVQLCTDPRSALETCRGDGPDLVLLDVNMPEVDGFAVIRQLKADPGLRDIPVVFLTGEGDSDAIVRGFDLGAVDYVTKPFDPAILRARVRAALHTKSLLDLLRDQAQLDGLTGLQNRASFDERLSNELDACRRYQRSVALLMVDIDHFKSVNDTFGHPVGDQVIRIVARSLRAQLRSSDVPCRYGGEEFALILGGSGADEALQVAERICQALREDTAAAALIERPITVSIGAAVTDGELDAATLVERADAALYEAKQGGRDQARLSGV